MTERKIETVPTISVTKKSAKTLKRNADDLFSKWVRKDARCLAAGVAGIRCSDRLECCHIKSRGHGAIRHSPFNAIPMCNAHHRHFTEHPDYWVAFIEALFPGRWQLLNDMMQEARMSKPDYEYWIGVYKGAADSWTEWLGQKAQGDGE